MNPATNWVTPLLASERQRIFTQFSRYSLLRHQQRVRGSERALPGFPRAAVPDLTDLPEAVEASHAVWMGGREFASFRRLRPAAFQSHSGGFPAATCVNLAAPRHRRQIGGFAVDCNRNDSEHSNARSVNCSTLPPPRLISHHHRSSQKQRDRVKTNGKKHSIVPQNSD